MHLDDEELVRRAKNGDKEAMSELFTRGREKIFDYLCRYMKNQHDAEDVIVDAFMLAYQNIGKYDPGKGSFMSWLFTVCRNCARSEFRKRSKNQTVSFDEPSGFEDGLALDETIVSNDERPDYAAREKEMDEALTRIIASLDPIYREVIVLCDIEGMSHEDAAALLGINRITLITRHRRAAERIHEALKKDGFNI